MMSTPEKTFITPVNGSPHHSVPPGALPPPNSITSPFQWNMVLGPNQTNVLPASHQWNVPQVGPQNLPPTTTHQWTFQPFVTGQNLPNDFLPQLSGATSCHQTFLKGKPKALGIVLIVTAISQLLLAISLPFLEFSITFISGVQIWGPVFYIITGSFTIRAQKKQNISLVKSSYGMNIVSSLFSFSGIVINIVDFAVIECEEYYDCYDEGATITIVAILLVLNLLVFCVAVSVAIFGGRALDHVPLNVPPVFVVQNVVSVPPSAFPSNSPETSIPPPPYMG